MLLSGLDRSRHYRHDGQWKASSFEVSAVGSATKLRISSVSEQKRLTRREPRKEPGTGLGRLRKFPFEAKTNFRLRVGGCELTRPIRNAKWCHLTERRKNQSDRMCCQNYLSSVSLLVLELESLDAAQPTAPSIKTTRRR